MRYFLFVVASAAILSSYVTTADDVPETFDYGAFVERYHKGDKWVDLSPLEKIARAKLFIGRTLQIFKHNISFLIRNVGHFLTQNEFTDLTPREIKSTFSSEQSDLIPVREAQYSPNLPANLASSVLKLKSSKTEPFSRGTAQEVMRRPQTHIEPVSFLYDPNIDLKAVLEELRKNQEDVEKLATLADVGRLNNHIASEQHKNAAQQVSSARAPNEIKFKQIVEADNKEFDPSSIPSKGLMSNSNGWKHFDLDYYMNEMDMNPRYRYDEPTESDSDGGRSTIASLISSIRSIHDQLSAKRDEAADDEEETIDDVAPESGEAEETSHLEPAHPSTKGGDIFYKVDWRRSQCISRTKQQSKCNSCYAFASLDLLEFFYCRKTKTRTEFSVQYLMDCGQKVKLNGCKGGKISFVGEFVRKYGVQLNAIYPYQAEQQECPFVSENVDENKWHYLRPTVKAWKLFSDMAAWYKWLPKSPLVVGINMPTDFMAYGGGIHDGQSCDPEMVHAMLLVGSGIQDGKSFWLLKNTFSFAWGEGGYFRLAHKAPLRCFNSAVVALVDF